jgi:WD40 repeat protein
MTMLRFLGLGIVLGLLAGSPIVSAEEKAPTEPPVFCPALDSDGLPWLVVRGTTTPVPNEQKRVQVMVDRVLFGSCNGNPVRFYCDKPLSTEHQLIALTPDDKAPDYWFMKQASEKEMQILGDLQLDYQAQEAQGIVLAREIERQPGKRVLEVVRPLLGGDLKAGERIRVRWRFGEPLLEEHVKDQPPALFFFTRFDALKGKEREAVGWFRRPASDEAAVVASIKRRGSHPIVEITEGGVTERRREIRFRGTVAEAVALLGSENPNVRLLGSRRLAGEHSKDRTLLPKLIAEALPGAGTASPAPFRELHNLIRLLGELQPAGYAEEPTCRLLDQHLTHLAGSPEEPPGTRLPAWRRPVCSVGREHDLIGEEDQEDINHSLVWLLRQIRKTTVQGVYAPKLLHLRDRVRGHARREVQLALDVFGIEERIELEQGQARTKGLTPVRVLAGLRQGGTTAAAFSRDGRLLAFGGWTGVSVWRTQDWTRVGQVFKVNPAQALAFSPDASLLYVGHSWGVVSYDFRTGKVVRTFRCENVILGKMELSADGKRLAIIGLRRSEESRGTELHVWETATGRVLRSLTHEEGGEFLTLDSDGRTLIREVKIVGPAGEDPKPTKSVTGWRLEAADANGPPLRDLSEKDFWMFLPRMSGQAGQQLLSLEKPSETWSDKPRSWTLRIHDASQNFKEIARREDIHFGTRLAVSADGRTLVVTDHKHGEHSHKWVVHFTVLSLPRLEVLARWEWRRFERTEIQDLALSPDGRTLALTSERGAAAPHLFETWTGRRILPTAGHPGWVQHVFFSSDGQTVRTFDDENYVCLWDARTMRLRNRIALDGAWRIVSLRDGDGKYLLCQDCRYDGADHPYCIVDADTAGIVCTLTDFRPERDPVAFWLNDRRMVLSLEKHVLHVDYMTGVIVKEVPVAVGDIDPDWKPRWHGGQLSLDYLDREAASSPRFKVRSLDLDTGKIAEQGAVQLLQYSRAHGSMPGNRFHYLFHPYFYLIDRRTGRVVLESRFGAGYPWSLGFSADGSRFTVLLQLADNDRMKTVCVHDVETGRLLAALPNSEHYSGASLSPDGRRVLVVMDDGALEMWDLSELDAY